MNENTSPEKWLKDNGLKSTKQRAAMISILLEATGPMDAEGILEKMKTLFTHCNLSTIYRNMEIMIQRRLVTESRMGVKAYFALNQHRHGHYVQCLSCKSVVMVEGCPFEQYERQLEESLGFKMLGHKVELFGICKTCSAKDQ